MFFKKFNWAIIILLLAVLTSCNNAAKEAETYYDEVYKGAMEERHKVEKSMEEFFNAVTASKPEEAIELLEERVIPEHEVLADILNEAELTQDELIDFNNLSIEVTNYSEETFVLFHTIFKELMDQEVESNDIHLDTQLENIKSLNEKYFEKKQAYEDKLNEIAEKYNSFTVDETEFLRNDEINTEEASEQYEELIVIFMESVSSSEIQSSSTGDSSDKILTDDDQLEVTFNGEVTIDQTFIVKGKSNLPEGAHLQVLSFHYGSENPYLKGKVQVEKDGTFLFETDVEKDDLNGEPIEVQVQFTPHHLENEEFQDKYGAEGENIEGSFKHKITDIKRTRTAAIASAHIEFKSGAKASFDKNEWNEPSDYGDFNVRVEEAHVDIKDEYYDITMNSNLIELTGIKATIEIPGYDVAGYTSRAVVNPDGSFRFQIPRPDVDDADIILVIESNSSMSIETEELYGENGEKFEGELVENTKKGQKIMYEFRVEDNN